MKENVFKNFINDTYKTSSPIPYIITIQVVFFILIHLFDLINISSLYPRDLYKLSLTNLSLDPIFSGLIQKPWSLFTYPFVYNNLFTIAFDCLWLFWIGNIYINLLQVKYFNMTFFGGLLIGAIIFLLSNSIPTLSMYSTALQSTTFGLVALLGGLILLSPKAEIRLFLFGNVSLKTLALVFIGIELLMFMSQKQFSKSIALIASVTFGFLFIQSLYKGKDWTKIFSPTKKSKLKVVHRRFEHNISIQNESIDQEIIDEILDKISEKGYDSLNKKEKEILFKASKKD